MEMIFHQGDLYKQYLENGDHIIQPRCFVFGQLMSPLEIEPTGETNIFSVRFYPEGFMPFASIPIKQMEQKAVSLEDLYGEEGLVLGNEVLSAGSTPAKIAMVEQFLLKRLCSSGVRGQMVKETVDLIFAIRGQLTIAELSQQMKINRKQLERKFSAVIGLSPKQLSRIIRLQAALKQLLHQQFVNLTDLAYEGEYYDQAHFIKDFKTFTGVTPKKIYGENLQLSSLFYGKD